MDPEGMAARTKLAGPQEVGYLETGLSWGWELALRTATWRGVGTQTLRQADRQTDRHTQTHFPAPTLTIRAIEAAGSHRTLTLEFIKWIFTDTN